MKLYAALHRQHASPSVGVRAMAGLVLCLIVISAGGSANAGAQGMVSGSGEIAHSFESSARHWNVPLPVLMAVGYVESHWEQRGGAPTDDQGYGIMHITYRPDGTLDLAASLTGLSADAIRLFPEANIEAGAALLSDISQKLPGAPLSQTDLGQWYPVVERYLGSPDADVSDSYAQQVFQTIRDGALSTLQSGEVVDLQAVPVKNMPSPRASVPASDDYPPALWVPANSNNYTVGRPYPPLDTIVIHDTEGSYSSAISWFQNPSAGAAAHYVIRSADGQITQMVRNANTAYHTGVWDYNVRAIGIEHEGFMSQQGWYTEPMYQASAGLVRYLTELYGIKKDRAHIIGHYQIPNQSHVDPGPNWNWTYYMSLVRRDSERAALVDNTDPGFSPTPSQIDPQHYWWTYAGGYAGSNSYSTSSVTYQSSSVNSASWSASLQSSGYYDVYAFIPYVDNSTPDTSAAKYHVYASNGDITSVVSQRAITDVGSGSWANLGKFYFAGGQQARISLSDWTGETGKNVWFDAVMWIPSTGGGPPPPVASPTPPPVSTPANTPTPAPTDTPAATWTPGPCGMRFSDLPDSHWAYPYVSYLFCDGVVGGYADNTFRPNNGSTRGQFAKMLVLAMGWPLYDPVDPTFADVPPDNSFFTYIESAYLYGAIGGYSDGTFRPNNLVTRAQAAKMLVIGRGWSLVNPQSPTFPDVPLNHWAFPYVETAVSYGVVGGFADGLYRPDLPINRAQLAKIVALAMQTARAARPAAPPSTTARVSRPTATIPQKEASPTR